MFDELVKEELEMLEERRVSGLKGSLRISSQTFTYSTESMNDSFVVTVSNMSGKVGTVEISQNQRKVYYYNEKDQVIEVGNISSANVNKKSLENEYIPELVKRVSSNTTGSFV